MTNITSSTLASMASSTQTTNSTASDTYSNFLTILTTQMQNQDPLDPMDSSEFTNQLVQFSQVEQALLTNEKLDALLTLNNSAQIGPALNYIGNDVYFQGDIVYYEDEDLQIGFAIGGEAAQAKLHIFNADNELIRTIDLPENTTSGSITWDGLDDQGNKVDTALYSLEISALDENNKALYGYTGVPAYVEGVENIDDTLYLALNGDRRILASSVLSVTEPDTTNLPTTDTPPPSDGETTPSDSE